MKANGKRVVSRLEEIYQCGKKEDGTQKTEGPETEINDGKEVCLLGPKAWHDMQD